MIIELRSLRANRKYLRVTAIAGPQAGLEDFVFRVAGTILETTEAFAPGEMKAVTVEHKLAGIHAPVEVSSSNLKISAMLSLTGDEDWPYPDPEDG